MLQYLAAIYINPNKVRDAWYNYNRLIIKLNQPFTKF